MDRVSNVVEFPTPEQIDAEWQQFGREFDEWKARQPRPITVDEAVFRQIIITAGDDPSDLDAVHGDALASWAVRAVEQLRLDYNECLFPADVSDSNANA